MPDLKGADGTKEYMGFYMLLRIDNRYAEMDDTINWYTGQVIGAKMVRFQMPAWPFPLWPQGPDSQALYSAVLAQVDGSVQKFYE